MTSAELRQLRLDLELTQGQFAELLGLKRQQINKLENGKRKLRGAALKLAEYHRQTLL